MVGCCELGNEPSGSSNGRAFLDKLSEINNIMYITIVQHNINMYLITVDI